MGTTVGMNKATRIVFTVFISLLFLLNVAVKEARATGVYDLPMVAAGENLWVVDEADVISRATEGQLSNMLRQLAENTGKEVRMVVIERLDYGQTIDSLAREIFQTWYPSPADAKNQVLIVVDTLGNRTAIAQGDDTVNLLTPEIRDSIVHETFPYFLKDLQYNQALISAGNRLVAVLSGKQDPGAPKMEEINIESTFASAEETDTRSAILWTIVLLVLATVIPMVTYFWYVGFPGN